MRKQGTRRRVRLLQAYLDGGGRDELAEILRRRRGSGCKVAPSDEPPPRTSRGAMRRGRP